MHRIAYPASTSAPLGEASEIPSHRMHPCAWLAVKDRGGRPGGDRPASRLGNGIQASPVLAVAGADDAASQQGGQGFQHSN